MRTILPLVLTLCAGFANAQFAAPGPGEIPGNLPMPVFFTVSLSGANVVPPNDSTATGDGTLMLDVNTLTYAIRVERFSFRRAEIHGPAGPGENAPMIFDLGQPGCAAPLPPFPGSCLFRGTVTLSDEQRNDLVAGLWYVQAYSDGETPLSIRGQIVLADSDRDGDGVPDGQDQCPDTRAGSLVNKRGCSIEQLCPCERRWLNHAQYFKCVREAAREFAKAGLITERQKRRLLLEAAKSDCGKRRR